LGQYYVLANLTKEEFVNAHEIGGLLKHKEWALNLCQSGPIVLLIGVSNESGGGAPDRDDPDIFPVAGRWRSE